MTYIPVQLRELRREVARLHRRLAQARLPGKVSERDPETGRVRLDLGEDPETGDTILSPWVRVQSLSAGTLKISRLPSIGEQLYLDSASGLIGADSVASWGCFDQDDNPRPEHEADETVITQGELTVRVKAGEARISAGDATVWHVTSGAITASVDGSAVELTSSSARLRRGGTALTLGEGQITSTHVITPGASV